MKNKREFPIHVHGQRRLANHSSQPLYCLVYLIVFGIPDSLWFNRTLKGKLERLDLEYNESGASVKSWEQFMGATLFAYNHGTTLRGLFELMNHKAPIVKTFKGIAHRRTGDKPYVYNKRTWIHPR